MMGLLMPYHTKNMQKQSVWCSNVLYTSEPKGSSKRFFFHLKDMDDLN